MLVRISSRAAQNARPEQTEYDVIKSDYLIPQLAQSVEAPEHTTESEERPTAGSVKIS